MKKMNILTFDYEKMDLEVLSANLKRFGLRLEIMDINDLGLAIKQAASVQFDLILCDPINLGDFIRTIRQGPNKDSLVVAWTKNCLFGDQENAYQAGFNRYFVIPSDNDAFFSFLKDLASISN